MSRRFAAVAAPLALAVAGAAALAAQAPRIVNGRLSQQPAGSPFAQSFTSLVASQPDVAWLGYTVPVVAGSRTLCCADSGSTFISGTVIMVERGSCCLTCRLEPSSERTAGASAASTVGGPVRLEASEHMAVLVRVAERRIDRVRVFSSDCELDAGGRPVVWIENVPPADSVAMLEALISRDSDRRDRVADGAVAAIALHRDAAADAALDRLVAPEQPIAVRKKATFWLGQARGSRGLSVLRRLLESDSSIEVRKSAAFGVSQSPEAGATDTLIVAARTNSEPAVRGEAIFWLGQKAGAKAAAAITERIDEDPETEVKKRAVFALSQLPKAEGVPLLIKVARTHSNAAVRKQAMFWLAQSRDQRAIDFFAEILK